MPTLGSLILNKLKIKVVGRNESGSLRSGNVGGSGRCLPGYTNIYHPRGNNRDNRCSGVS